MQVWTIPAAALLLAVFPAAGGGELPVSPEGKKLARRLDKMEVEKHWLPGEHITDWKTGEPDGKKGGPPTHCSLFVAAACFRLGVPMLEPPPQTFLSNRQQEWLLKEGKAKGWKQVKDMLKAQKLANQGMVVVASYRNPNPKKAGHIAMVRPAAVTPAAVEKSGPRICQAGQHNYNDIDLKTGFKNHPGAWSKKEILFFAHQLPAPK
jgi:hypothetical protein